MPVTTSLSAPLSITIKPSFKQTPVPSQPNKNHTQTKNMVQQEEKHKLTLPYEQHPPPNLPCPLLSRTTPEFALAGAAESINFFLISLIVSKRVRKSDNRAR